MLLAEVVCLTCQKWMPKSMKCNMRCQCQLVAELQACN